MNIQMIGIDHQLAPVDYREIFSFTPKASIRAMDLSLCQGCLRVD